MTLDEKIQQLVTLGEKDPWDVADKLLSREDEQELRASIDLRSVIADRARVILGNDRRKAQHQLKPGDATTTAELRLKSFWVPGPDGFTIYKRADKCTAEDFELRAAFHERLAAGNLKQAEWCREIARLMRAEGAPTLAKLKAALPSMDGELFELPVAA